MIKTSIFTLLLVCGLLVMPTMAFAACTNNEDGNPGQEGEIEFFSDNVLRYCDDTNWIEMSEIPSTVYKPKVIKLDPNDGVADYLYRADPGMSPMSFKTASMSAWVRRLDLSTGGGPLTNGDFDFNITSSTGGRVQVIGRDSSGTTIFDVRSDKVNDTEWHHVLVSLDMDDVNATQIYVDDATIPFNTNTFSAGSTLYIDAITSFFASGSGAALASGVPQQSSYMEVADLWVDTGTYLDFSIEANRRKFMDAVGNPVYLGANGELPTGSSPEYFFTDPPSTYTNRGTNPDTYTTFGTIENGTSSPYTPPASIGLVGYWKLDETTATTTVIDSSGNGNNLTMQNGMTGDSSTTDGVVGTALDFDGTDDYLSGLPFASGELGTVHTIAFWAKSDLWKVNNKIGFGRGGNANTVVGFKDNKMTYGNTSGSDIDVGIFADIREWRHYAFVRNGTNVKFYLDGEYRDQGTLSNPAALSLDAFGRRSGGVEFYDGKADDLRIYTRVLGADHISALYHCTGPGTYFYNFSEDVMQWCDYIASPNNMATPASGSGGCTVPLASEGALDFSTDRYRYCDGNGWVDIGK